MSYKNTHTISYYRIYVFQQEKESKMQELVTELRDRVGVIAQGGGAKAIKRHTDKGMILICIMYPNVTLLEPVFCVGNILC